MVLVELWITANDHIPLMMSKVGGSADMDLDAQGDEKQRAEEGCSVDLDNASPDEDIATLFRDVWHRSCRISAVQFCGRFLSSCLCFS